MSNTAVFGIYPTMDAAEESVENLKAGGFRNTDISILCPSNVGTKDFAHQKNTKAPEGTAAGGATGAIIGGVLGYTAGIGSLVIPGLGLLAAGPLVAALAGVGAGGVVGGLTGALIGAGIPEYEAKRFAGRVKRGSILLSVHCDNREWTKKGKKILADTGAQDIAATSEASADFAKSDKPQPRKLGRSLP